MKACRVIRMVVWHVPFAHAHMRACVLGCEPGLQLRYTVFDMQAVPYAICYMLSCI